MDICIIIPLNYIVLLNLTDISIFKLNQIFLISYQLLSSFYLVKTLSHLSNWCITEFNILLFHCQNQDVMCVKVKWVGFLIFSLCSLCLLNLNGFLTNLKKITKARVKARFFNHTCFYSPFMKWLVFLSPLQSLWHIYVASFLLTQLFF